MQPNRLGNRLLELQDFLTIDHFHLGVKPYDHIRRLEIGLSNLSLRPYLEVLNALAKDNCALYKVRAMRSFHLSFKLEWDRLAETYQIAFEAPYKPSLSILRQSW
jgi:hypothetical protein